jgi:hypothetical protein
MKTKLLHSQIVILFVVTMIAACVTTSPTIVGEAPVPEAVAVAPARHYKKFARHHEALARSEQVPIPVRDVLMPREKPPTGYGAYGYLIFTKKPNVNDPKRWVKTCEAFLQNLEPVSAYSSSPNKFLLPTYWLGTKKFNKQSSNCITWVDEYDYARAEIIVSAMSSLASTGPLLVAWSKPFEDTSNGEKALVIDLSGFSEDEFERIFGIWMDRISRDPTVWQNGLKLVLAKEAFRDVLNTHGDDFIRAIETVHNLSATGSSKSYISWHPIISNVITAQK